VESTALPVFEAIIDATGVADHLEDLLPKGVRERQLKVRTLLLGILLALSDGRPEQPQRGSNPCLHLERSDR
jgi:hypothetical protein